MGAIITIRSMSKEKYFIQRDFCEEEKEVIKENYTNQLKDDNYPIRIILSASEINF
jgi:hypothetical protein